MRPPLHFTSVYWMALAGAAPAQLPDGARVELRECAEEVEVIRARAWSSEGEGDAVPSWAQGVPGPVWRLVEAASAAVENEDARRCFLDAAEEDARVAVAASAADGRFGLAAVLGFRADTEDGRAKVDAATELNDELHALLEEQPDHARARHILGRLHAGVRRMNRLTRWIATTLLGGATLRGATWEEAELHLLFAERNAPEVSQHHLHLGMLYQDTDRPDLALEELRHVLAFPAVTPLEIWTLSAAQARIEELERSR